jgi:hypothetical protein
VVKLPEDSGFPAFVAQRIEHLTTDQKVGGSSPSKRTSLFTVPSNKIYWILWLGGAYLILFPEKEPTDVILWKSIPVVSKAVVDQFQVSEAIKNLPCKISLE